MATARDAAAARILCALARITDLVSVTNIDCANCTMDVEPSDACSPGKRFKDFGIEDGQMEFFKQALAACSPEQQIKSVILHFPPIPAATVIDVVVGKLEGLLLGLPGWDGTCMATKCFERNQ